MVYYLALWLLVRVAGRLPLGLLDPLAAAAGTAAWWASRRVREVTRDHMRHVLGPGTASRDVDRMARACVRAAARGYVEFARLPRTTPDEVRAHIAEIEGLEVVEAALAEGRGAIALSAHLGAPELISHAAPALGVRFAGIAEPLEPPRVHDFVRSVREGHGIPYFPATLAGLREARAHLAAGGMLGILGDRDVLGTGRPYPFFGERTAMPIGAVELARRTGAPLLWIVCLRAGRGERAGRYRIVARRIALPTATGDRERDLDSGMRAAIAAMEAGIRSAPGQWFPLAPVWSGLAADGHGAARLQ